MPISSWVGFEIGLIQEQLDAIRDDNGGEYPEGLSNGSAFSVFIDTIPYRFYPIFLLFLQVTLIALQFDFGPMLVAERKVRVFQRKDGGDGKFAGAILQDVNKPETDTPMKAWNMLMPLFFLVFFILQVMINSGTLDWNLGARV